MSYLRILIFSLVVFSLGTAGVAADQVEGLYEASVLVYSQSERERNRAASEALAQVLVRVSGTAEVLGRQEIQGALTKAHRSMHQFAYESTDELLPSLRGKDLDPVPAIRLRAHFQPKVVNGLLKQAGAPIWPNNRPRVLVFLAVEDEQGRRIVNSDSDPEVAAELLRHMQRRGLPALLPNLDLEDGTLINSQIIWDHDVRALQYASAEYGVQAVLSGRAFKTSDERWIGDWTLIHNDVGQRLAGSDKGRESSLDSFLAAGVDQVAEDLSALYSVVSRFTVNGELLLHVSDVRSFVAYWRLTEYLQDLTSVQSVQVVKVDGPELWLRLATDVSREDLQKEIALDSLLVVETPGGVSLSGSAALERTPEGLPVLESAPLPAALLNYRWAHGS